MGVVVTPDQEVEMAGPEVNVNPLRNEILSKAQAVQVDGVMVGTIPGTVPEINKSTTPFSDLSTALAKVVPPIPSTSARNVKGDNYLVLEVRSTDARSNEQRMTLVIDNEKPISSWGVLERAGVAKMDVMGSWAKESLPTIINAIVFCEKMGLSFEEGDVYISPQGRIATTAKAKFKRGLRSGKIESWSLKTEVFSKSQGWVDADDAEKYEDIVELEIPWQTQKGASGKWIGPNMRTTVTIKTTNLSAPIVYKGRLKEWFVGRNENWRERTRYMLEENAKGKAFDSVDPAGADIDAISTES